MSELFTELTDQQQELVAGGAITTLNLNVTNFKSNTELLESSGASASGPGGSVSFGQIAGANQEVENTAINYQAGTVI